MADGLDLPTIMRQLVQNAGASVPGALQAAAAGDRQASALEGQRLDEGENFLRNYDQGRVNLPLLSGFGAMMAPTRTGSLSESLSNAIGSGVGALQKQRAAEMDRFGKLQAIQDARARLAAVNGSMQLTQAQRALGMVGGLGSVQGVLANSDLAAALARAREPGGNPVASTGAPTPPASGLSSLGQLDANAAPSASPAPDAAAPASSPFGALPIKRPGTPTFPIDHGPVTSTPPGMNAPQGIVIGGDHPTSSAAPMPSPGPAPSPAMPAPSAQAPSAVPFAQSQAPSDNGAYGGQRLSPEATRQLDTAFAMRQAALQFPTAPNAPGAIEQADKIAKQYIPEGFYYDPGSKRVMPTGQNNPAFVAAKTLSEEGAKLDAQNMRKGVTPAGDEYAIINPQGVPGAPSASPALAGNATGSAQGQAGQGAPQQRQQTPPQANLDAVTAKVQTAIPAPPKEGGYAGTNLPPGAVLTKPGDLRKEQATVDTQFMKDFMEKAPTTDIAAERFRAMAQAFKLVQSGSTTERLSGWAAIAQSYGQPDLAQKILGGDPAAVQWIEKNGVNLVLDTLKAATPRFAQSEFNKLAEKGVPTPENLPQANHQMISEGLGMLLRNQAFFKDWNAAKQQGWQSPSAFYEAWSAKNPLSTFQRAAQRQIGNFRGMPLPPAKDMAQGTIYVVPRTLSADQQKYFAGKGMKPGDLFRYNGPGSGIAPISPSDNFSAHLE